jgi:hypothetical protein
MHRQLEDIELASVALGVTSGFSKCKKTPYHPMAMAKSPNPRPRAPGSRWFNQT